LAGEPLGQELGIRLIGGLLGQKGPPLSLADEEGKFRAVDPRLLYKAQSLDIIH
jgi:hypothetical protein